MSSRAIWKHGILLGLFVGAWTFVVGFTGWYKDPALQAAFFLVIPIQVAVLWWGLRATAVAGRKYGGQVAAGTLISLIGGVLIIASSLLFTTVVFPDYFSELRALQAEMLRGQGMSEDQIRSAVEVSAAMQTPMIQALAGFLGTMVTGIVVSLILAAFVRRK